MSRRHVVTTGCVLAITALALTPVPVAARSRTADTPVALGRLETTAGHARGTPARPAPHRGAGPGPPAQRGPPGTGRGASSAGSSVPASAAPGSREPSRRPWWWPPPTPPTFPRSSPRAPGPRSSPGRARNSTRSMNSLDGTLARPPAGGSRALRRREDQQGRRPLHDRASGRPRNSSRASGVDSGRGAGGAVSERPPAPRRRAWAATPTTSAPRESLFDRFLGDPRNPERFCQRRSLREEGRDHHRHQPGRPGRLPGVDLPGQRLRLGRRERQLDAQSRW